MKSWKELVNEVEEKGFEKASAEARLAWACETVNGIDQHLAPDLKELFERLQYVNASIEEWDQVTGLCRWGCEGDSIDGHEEGCIWFEVAAVLDLTKEQ